MKKAILDTINSVINVGLSEKLDSSKALNVKLGFDPTSPDLHLGHFIVLRGAKKFQDAGHVVTIIVGDFTASIGDPSGRNKLRPPLSSEKIIENAKTYMEQVFLVLDKSQTIVKHNSEWLNEVSLSGIIKLLASGTVSQILARDDFSKRFESNSPIHMHELIYPFIQASDSVAIAADVELGGTDQTFNLMMGRQLQKHVGKEEQAVVTFPLLVGLDGVEKMSKSLGNHIGLLDSPTDKFGKIMSISDDTMWNYFSVLLEKSDEQILAMKTSNVNPKILKMELARDVVKIFHGPKVALFEHEKFDNRFTNRQLDNIDEVELSIDEDSILLSKVIKELGMSSSNNDSNRKIEQNGVKVDSLKVNDKNMQVFKGDNFLLQVGKVHAKRVKIN